MWGTKEAARELGLSEQMVRKLLLQGKLKARKISGRWVILSLEYDRRPPGRPRK